MQFSPLQPLGGHMKFILFSIFILTSFSAVANNPSNFPENHSDAFHNSAFGSGSDVVEQQRQEEEVEDIPEWVTPEVTPEIQRQEEKVEPARVNEWQENSKRAKEGEGER